MAHELELLAELERARDSLLTPHAAAMRDCELSLERAVGFLRNNSRRGYGVRVKRAVETIRFLLERARAFWNARPVSAGPGIEYSCGGRLVQAPAPSRFTIEV